MYQDDANHRYSSQDIASCALFLAAKVEEQPRKLEHVIKVCHLCLHRDGPPLDMKSEVTDDFVIYRVSFQQCPLCPQKYVEQAKKLVENENIMLQALGFDVAIEHPHTCVVKCCQLVRGKLFTSTRLEYTHSHTHIIVDSYVLAASKDLAQTSYFMATNSLHLTTMCLQVKPTMVACVCIHLACKWSRWTVRSGSLDLIWHRLMLVDA